MSTRRAGILLLLAVLALTLGARCGKRLKTIVVDVPVEAAVIDDASVLAVARVGTNFDLSTLEVRVDGVDLIAALALVPPFEGASGVVMVGASPVGVDAFDVALGNPRRVELVLTGLPSGPHVFEVLGENAEAVLVSDAHAFTQTGPMTLELAEWTAAGLPLGPLDAGAEGTLANAALGQPFAAPPVVLTDGGTLHPGHVPAAEARISP